MLQAAAAVLVLCFFVGCLASTASKHRLSVLADEASKDQQFPGFEEDEENSDLPSFPAVKENIPMSSSSSSANHGDVVEYPMNASKGSKYIRQKDAVRISAAATAYSKKAKNDGSQNNNNKQQQQQKRSTGTAISSSSSSSSSTSSSSVFLGALHKRGNRWTSRFCKHMCRTCQQRLTIGVAALCVPQCDRGLGDSYIACLVTSPYAKASSR